jgi:hypothetical protein
MFNVGQRIKTSFFFFYFHHCDARNGFAPFMKIYRLFWVAMLIPFILWLVPTEKAERLSGVNNLRLSFLCLALGKVLQPPPKQSKSKRRKCYLRTNIEKFARRDSNYNFYFSLSPFYGVARDRLVGGKMVCSCSIYANLGERQ